MIRRELCLSSLQCVAKDCFIESTKGSMIMFDTVNEIYFSCGFKCQTTAGIWDMIDVLQFRAISCNSDVQCWWPTFMMAFRLAKMIVSREQLQALE